MTADPVRSSPYQGLPAFEETDAGYFFGRQKDARLVVADLFASPLTVLYGASGVGKSSLLRAGVIPLLKGRQDLLVVVFSEWQGDPVTALRSRVDAAVASLPRRADGSVPGVPSGGLDEYLIGWSTMLNRRVMVILDQFEEYFLYHPQADDFAGQFARAANIGSLSLSFLLSMREEALARLDRFEGRIRTLFDNYRRVDHLDRDAGREAIERPLQRFTEEHGGDAPSRGRSNPR
jgi:hypothetical protein